MNREHQKGISDRYENDFVTEGKFGKRTMDSHRKKIQSSELTGTEINITQTNLINHLKSQTFAQFACLQLLCAVLSG